MYCYSNVFSRVILRTVSTAFVAFAAILIAQISIIAQAEADPQEAVSAFNSAQDLHEKGDLAGAIKLYEKALKLVPEFPEAAYQLGIAQVADGKPDDAERSFRHAVELRPDWSLALAKFGETLVARFLENRGPDRSLISTEAASVLKKALAIDPNNSPAVVALAELSLNNSTSDAGILEVLEKLRGMTDGKLKPAANLWVARASLESRLGKSDLAKSSLANALTAEPKNRTALFQLADIAIVEGNTGRASELAAQLDSGPGPDQLNLLKARIFAADGKLDEAVKRLDAIRGSSAAADDLRTKIKSMQSSSPAELEKQLETNAKDAVVLGRLCTIYRRDDPAKSLDYCRRAAEAEPGNIHHAVGFGAALVQAKQYDAAASILRMVIAIAPDNSSAHANLATALFQLKRYPEAKAEFEWLTSNQPSAAGAYLFLGILHDQLAEYMDAMANYQQYIRLADPVGNKLDIDKVNLRLPALQKLIKEGKGKKDNY